MYLSTLYHYLAQISLMTAIALKKKIYQVVDAIDDASLLQAVYTILNKSLQSNEFKPMNLDSFYNKIEDADKAYKNGNVITHNDLKKKIKSWRKK